MKLIEVNLDEDITNPMGLGKITMKKIGNTILCLEELGKE